MKIHLGGVGKGGVGILDNRGVYQAVAEHGCTVHRYAITGLERAMGVRVGMWWWEQVGIDLAGGQEAAAAISEGDGREE